MDTVSVSLRSLTEWWGRSGIRMNREEESRNVAVQYTSQSPLVLQAGVGFRASIRPTLSYSRGQYDMSMEEKVRFEVQATNEPRALSEFDQVIHAWQDFLTIASLNCCQRAETFLLPPAMDGGQECGTYHAVPVYRARQRNAAFGLFRFADVPDDGTEVLSQWLSQAEELRYVRALYCEGVYGKGLVEQKFLFLTQAAEAFHRRYYSGLYMENQEQFETEVLHPLTEAIPATVQRPLRDAISARLAFANELSLRRRLRELFEEHRDTLCMVVSDPGEYVTSIVDLRNAFTHFPVGVGQNLGGQSTERAVRYNWVLRLLLEACFMRVMGFGIEQIVSCVRRSETYRQITERFREEDTESVV